MCRETGLHGSEGAWGWQQPPATRLGVGEGSTGSKKERVITPGDGLGLDAGAVDVELTAVAGEGDVPGAVFERKREGLLLHLYGEEGG